MAASSVVFGFLFFSLSFVCLPFFFSFFFSPQHALVNGFGPDEFFSREKHTVVACPHSGDKERERGEEEKEDERQKRVRES